MQQAGVSNFSLIVAMGVVASLCTGGCREAFVCEGQCVGSLRLSTENGALFDGPLPPATSTGREPIIVTSDWVPVDDDTFALEVEVRSNAQIAATYLEINSLIYVFSPTLVDGADFAHCATLAAQQGETCSRECIDACACAVCDNPVEQQNLRGSCSLACSVSSELIGEGLQYEDEVDFANSTYNGEDFGDGIAVPGAIAQLPGCRATSCAQLAAQDELLHRLSLQFHYVDDSFLDALNVGSLVVEADPPSGESTYSPPATAAAKVRIEDNGCIEY